MTLCLLGVCVAASALGFGREDGGAVLGRPLNFSVELRSAAGDDLRPECTRAEVLFGDIRVPPSEVRVRIDRGRAGAVLRVATLAAIDEPIVTVDVSVGCDSSSSRRFVALSEPPTVQVLPAQVVAAAPAPAHAAPSVRRNPAPAKEPAPQRSGSANGKQGGAGEKAQARPAARIEKVGDTPRAAGSSTTSPIVVAAATPASAPQGRPRLQLDPVDAAGSSVALAPEPSPEQVARENERAQALQRVQALEQSLAQLRDETARTGQALELLQARLRQAEEERYHNTLVYALLALCLLLALLAAWFWYQHPRASAAWWKAAKESQKGVLASDPQHEGATTGSELHSVAADAYFAPSTSAAPKWRLADQASRHSTEPEFVETTEESESERTVTLRHTASLVHTSEGAEKHVAKEVSIEELIDLEQQADFFTALGQDEAAIDLLKGHVSGHPDASPLPYLKLLEIYKRRGERDHYDVLRSDFNQRFNSYAPSWDADLQEGRSLEEYSAVTTRLQRLWATHPARALEVLQASLLRRDGAQTFDLPAYRELLMLYGVARDLAEQEPSVDDVDLLLPLEDFDEFLPSRLEPLSATMPVAPYKGPMPTGEVDLHLDFQDAPGPGAVHSLGDRDTQHSIEFEEIRVEPPVRLEPDSR